MSTPVRRELARGGALELDAEWLSPTDATALLNELVRDVAWEARDIVLFGKRILQPRLVAWAGDVPYRYSGQTLEARAFPDVLRSVTARVSSHTGVPFNHVLLNRYRDGNDSMGFHADDEPELGEAPTIASVSLGVTRRFVLRPRRGNDERIDVLLEHGTLLVMHAPCQGHYRHAIPKEPGVVGERVSLTLRHVVRAPRDSVHGATRVA